jgi:hypothetical protein
VANCDGVIRGNWISENRTFQGVAAGGLAWCHGLIEGNTIAGNASDSPDASGGGLAYCGGRRFAVDLGAYEFDLVQCDPAPDGQSLTVSWSLLPDRVYSLSWSSNLTTWSPAVRVPSAGNTVTRWTDDGSSTGGPPVAAPRRFYRIQETLRGALIHDEMQP